MFFLFVVPIDRNTFLYEYNKKVALLETIGKPRIIFIGGSNLAFNLDSRMLQDSLKYHIVNFGMASSIGLRYQLEDCYDYIQEGDVIVLQFEYENFLNNGNGDQDFLKFMQSVKWRRYDKLNWHQYITIIKTAPAMMRHDMKRLLLYPSRKSFDTPPSDTEFSYAASGFNEFGDEVSHFNYPSKPVSARPLDLKNYSKNFVVWLENIIGKYEQKGANVILLPPVCVRSFYDSVDTDIASQLLKEIGHPYVVSPSFMVQDDLYYFDLSYHLTRDGCIRNSREIMKILQPLIN